MYYIETVANVKKENQMKMLNEQIKLCQECGEEINDDDYDNYGVICHRECADDETNKTLQAHYFADMGDM